MKNLYILVGAFFVMSIFGSCEKKTEIRESTAKPSGSGAGKDERVNISIDYTKYDTRPLMSGTSYTAEQKAGLRAEFDTKMGKATTKRGKTATAAAFLAQLNYAIPYAYEWIIPEPGYELVGRYTRKGLFLDDVTETAKGVVNTYPAWGRMVRTHERYPRETVQGLGDSYENGFHCSSFIGWCLFNAGAIADTALLDRTYADNYKVFPGTRDFDLKNATDIIRPGDILWFPGHAAIVIALEGDYVIFASGEGGSVHNATRGVRWRAFNKKTTDYSTFQYKSLIQMKSVYGD